ncbi:MAG TPA: hypothetical protein VHS81_07280 [Caulobacteraceae bacterium]|nr:hypothetical protein [Caulobacteraceae bacterium]
MTDVTFSTSTFVPLALGFFGLGTGYLIYGPQELFKLPKRSRGVDLTTGIWGVWMPGFLQFLTGTYLWVGLSWFQSFREPPLYMAALAFTAYGVHWWALGMSRALGGDPRPNGLMALAFIVISGLGATVFFHAGDAPVGVLFLGLTAIYVCEVFASLGVREVAAAPGQPPGRVPSPLGELGERALGFLHLVTGLWLLYLACAVTLNTAAGLSLPV